MPSSLLDAADTISRDGAECSDGKWEQIVFTQCQRKIFSQDPVSSRSFTIGSVTPQARDAVVFHRNAESSFLEALPSHLLFVSFGADSLPNATLLHSLVPDRELGTTDTRWLQQLLSCAWPIRRKRAALEMFDFQLPPDSRCGSSRGGVFLSRSTWKEDGLEGPSIPAITCNWRMQNLWRRHCLLSSTAAVASMATSRLQAPLPSRNGLSRNGNGEEGHWATLARLVELLRVRAHVRIGWTLEKTSSEIRTEQCERCGTDQESGLRKVDLSPRRLETDLGRQAVWRVGSECGASTDRMCRGGLSEIPRTSASKLAIVKRIDKASRSRWHQRYTFAATGLRGAAPS